MLAPARYESRGRNIHFIRQQEGDHATAVILQPAPATERMRDELAYALLTHIAVGSLRSRSNTKLRHEAGLTYGVVPWVLRARGFGVLTIEGTFESDELPTALAQLLEMLGDLTKVAVSEQELTRAKAAVAATFQRAAGSNAGLADELGALFADAKSASWLAQVPEVLAELNAADVQRVARAYLRPADLEIAVAGGDSVSHRLGSLGRVRLYTVEEQ